MGQVFQIPRIADTSWSSIMENGVKTFTDTGSGDFGERYDANDYTDGMLCAIYKGSWYGNERYFMLHAAPVNGSTWGYAERLHGGRRWLDGTTYLVDGMYFYYENAGGEAEYYLSQATPAFEPFDTYADALYAITHYRPIVSYPITYRPTNCSFPGAPTEAVVGDTVVVPVTFPDGYGLVNESNIYVTNNGVVIPSTYSNGQLTFTMPDPS